MNKLTCLIHLIILLGLQSELYGWDNKLTHPAITERGIAVSTVDAYLKTQVGLADGVSTQLYWDFPPDIKKRISDGDAYPNTTTRSISEWLRVGSIIEDQDNRFFPPPWRPRHHFHDPIRNSGLDNHADHPDWDAPGTSSWLPLGQSAIDWAISGTAVQEPFTNNENWSAARTMFYDSLTSALESERQAQLAEAFLKLGCVLHMIEDMGVPAHTRNDFLFGHYRSVFYWGNPLEDWVEKQIEGNSGQSPWAGTAPVVFDTLAGYFDADIYAGGYLGDGILPPAEVWGLSECTNYQFLSLSTVFGCSGSLYQFPHPAIGKTTPFLEPVPEGLKGYFDGSNYGVNHLARDSYTRYRGVRYLLFGPSLDSTTTTDDIKVFEDYADITLPRTIDYAAGLINYFFRGSIDVAIGCPQGCDPATNTATYTMTITNTSMNTNREQVLKGGTFEFYWEDWSGDRAQATALTVYTYDPCDPCTTQLWNGNSILPYGEHIRAQVTFDVLDCTDIKDYAVIYKGAINDFEHPDDTDPDDAEALACWTKSASYSAPPQSYTLFVTESGGTDEYSECAAYLESIFNSENPDGYTLNKTPDSSCLDCRWYEMDYHTCPYGSPYCYPGCNIAQIMILRSPSSNSFCVIITPFPVAYCGFGPSCNGSYKRCFYKQAEESYADFWDRIFNGGVFGDGSETDCTEDGCIIPALFGWTDSWVRVMWIPTAGMAGGEGGMAEMDGGESISALPGVEGLLAETSAQASEIPSEPTVEEQIEQIKELLDWLDEIKDEIDEDIWLNLTGSLEEMLKELEDSQ
ncbi:MAG TPA: hypothetical protein HPP87_09955 [Planctomycetes bacterium]|nr:hypothetical protein [Planctomycetota bacterium]